MIKSVISFVPLFRGMDAQELNSALNLMDALEKEHPRNTIIASAGSRLTRFGIVLSGTVQVSFSDIDGNDVLMVSAASGDTFGESLCWLGVEEIPVTITAVSDAKILWLSPEPLKNGDNSAVACHLRNRFISMLAEKTLSMNDRVQALSKPTLRLKIITLLSQYSNRFGGKAFTLPFNRESLARYLGVNRTALSRELSAMERDGIIEFYKNTFKILK